MLKTNFIINLFKSSLNYLNQVKISNLKPVISIEFYFKLVILNHD